MLCIQVEIQVQVIQMVERESAKVHSVKTEIKNVIQLKIEIIDRGDFGVPLEVKIMPELMMRATELTRLTKINHDKDIM